MHCWEGRHQCPAARASACHSWESSKSPRHTDPRSRSHPCSSSAIRCLGSLSCCRWMLEPTKQQPPKQKSCVNMPCGKASIYHAPICWCDFAWLKYHHEVFLRRAFSVWQEWSHTWLVGTRTLAGRSELVAICTSKRKWPSSDVGVENTKTFVLWKYQSGLLQSECVHERESTEH
jgi:hypothetical protein